MPVSNSIRSKVRNAKRKAVARWNAARSSQRRTAPWLPNVAGKRYVRDESKSGVVSKLITR